MSNQTDNRRFFLIALALLFASPGVFNSLHYLGIVHHYHATTPESTLHTQAKDCLVHDFLLFSYLLEPLTHYKPPHFNYETLLIQGHTADRLNKPVKCAETRGPPLVFWAVLGCMSPCC